MTTSKEPVQETLTLRSILRPSSMQEEEETSNGFGNHHDEDIHDNDINAFLVATAQRALDLVNDWELERRANNDSLGEQKSQKQSGGAARQ